MGVKLDFPRGRWLRFIMAPLREGDRNGGVLTLPPERCRSVTGEVINGYGDVRLAFGFRSLEGPEGSEITVRMVVKAEQTELARELVARLALDHGVEDVPWTPWPPGPVVTTGQRDDWLSAPVSPETRALFGSVMARLTGGAES